MQDALDRPKKMVAVGLAGAFLLLGALVVAMPRWGALLFGIDTAEAGGLAYVRAIGFRDVALGLYIAALTLWSDRRTLALLLALTTVIPVLDFALVLAVKGLSSPVHLALHGASGAVFAGTARWVWRGRTPSA